MKQQTTESERTFVAKEAENERRDDSGRQWASVCERGRINVGRGRVKCK
jgi:hypothetical protein